MNAYPETNTAVDEAPEQEQAAIRATCHILVVDDEASMRNYVVEVLNTSGYETSEAGSGMEALKALRERHYDLVVTDFNMPNGSGGDLIVKMHSERMTQPVILMTGSAIGKEMMALSKMLQVETILSKPFGIDELLIAVEKALHTGQHTMTDLSHSVTNEVGNDEADRLHKTHH